MSQNTHFFELIPEEYRPTGTLNISRIDTVTLNIQLSEPPETSEPSEPPKAPPDS